MSEKTVAEARESMLFDFSPSQLGRIESLIDAKLAESLPAQPKAEPSGEAPTPLPEVLPAGTRFELLRPRHSLGTFEFVEAAHRDARGRWVGAHDWLEAWDGEQAIKRWRQTGREVTAEYEMRIERSSQPAQPQEQPAASGPGKPSGGAPSDDRSPLNTPVVDVDSESLAQRYASTKTMFTYYGSEELQHRVALHDIYNEGHIAGAASRDAEVAELRDKYHELLFQVGNVYPGETRHETALRYLRSCEQSSDACMGSELAALEARKEQ